MSRILFKKEGRAKFISHLDLMRTMQRVFIRAGIGIKHTEGFNPHPYMTFALPLSLGTESVCELMDFGLVDGADLEEVPARLNEKLPDGITVLKAYNESRKFKDIKWLEVRCTLVYDGGVPERCADALRGLYASDSLVIEKKTKRGSAEVDIIPLIYSINIEGKNEKEIVITAEISAQDPSLSPAQLVSAIEAKKPQLAPDFVSYRRIEVYDADHNVFR